MITDLSNKLKALVLMRFAFKEKTFKPKTDQSEMVWVEYIKSPVNTLLGTRGSDCVSFLMS